MRRVVSHWFDRAASTPEGVKAAWHASFVLLYVGAVLFHAAASRQHFRGWLNELRRTR